MKNVRGYRTASAGLWCKISTYRCLLIILVCIAGGNISLPCLSAIDRDGRLIYLEGVIEGGKAGTYLLEDDINGDRIGRIANSSDLDLEQLEHRKVKLLGAWIECEDTPFYLYPIQTDYARYTFHVLSILDVKESKCQKDIARLLKICDNKFLVFYMEDAPLRELINKINALYNKNKLVVEPDDLQDKLIITYCDDQETAVASMVLFLKRFELDVFLDDERVILRKKKPLAERLEGTVPNEKLYSAIKNNNLKDLALAIAEGANVNAKNKFGSSALHYAAHNGNLDILNVLIAKGGDVNIVDNTGITPLHLAVFCNKVEIVKILLNRGASLRLKTQDGRTPSDCVQVWTNPEIIKLLEEAAKKEESKL